MWLWVVASQEVNKIITFNPYMLGTLAGGAADCQFWLRYLGMQVVWRLLAMIGWPFGGLSHVRDVGDSKFDFSMVLLSEPTV